MFMPFVREVIKITTGEFNFEVQESEVKVS